MAGSQAGYVVRAWIRFCICKGGTRQFAPIDKGFLSRPFYRDRLFRSQLNLSFDAIGRHVQCEVEGIDALAEFKRPAD
jgi:hypothetical protein